ncbi:MAG: hypothetical protein NZM35_08325 [Chitinophagales bacterium]|nr:hypothetical protein [Chitinophagales bacterium]MDW8418892.1 hypothetical protein [Chitinophagales bacterium]
MPLLRQDKTDEEKALDLRWHAVRARVKEMFGRRPDLNAMLFLIGMNEVGIVKEHWEKEEKQELMHVAVCKLLSTDGYYTFSHFDAEGYPHYVANKTLPPLTLAEQERLLKLRIVEYFENL